MTSRTGWSELFALLLALWPTPAAAQTQQTTSIVSLQNLSFGLLLPGIRNAVSVADVSRRAVVALAGSGPVDITLVLPTALETAGGDRIPLRFSSGDAALINTSGNTLSTLDPLQTNRVQLGNDRTVLFVLGGTAESTAMTRPGHYAARVALLLNRPGT
ncbi:MAG: hypothetical protein JWL95_2328 [Gemmatimonadetes bacterium]|nr:hypothetical protein [Gemmatimonadota bacterium]